MAAPTVSLVADDVKVTDVIFTNPTGDRQGAITVQDGRFHFSPPYSNFVGIQGPTGPTGPPGIPGITEEENITSVGDSVQGISAEQSTNVLSYKDGDVTYRELGLYNVNVDNVSGVDERSGQRRIVSNYSIIPYKDGLTGEQGLNLGDRSFYWNSVYAKELYTTSGTIYVLDQENNSEMTIKYDPITLQATVSNNFATVKTVNTSSNIPGQIDANLLPFTGFSYVGKFNPVNYTANIGTNFFDQTATMAYNLNYLLTQSPFSETEPCPRTTNALFQVLSGAYYVVTGIEGNVVPMTFPKLSALTNLTSYDKNAEGDILTVFTQSEEKSFNLSNDDMLILSVGLEPSAEGIRIVLEWSQMQFKVPINGITTLNIVDNAVTNAKLSDFSVSSNKIRPSAVTYDAIAQNSVDNIHLVPGSVSFTKLDANLQRLLVKADGSISQAAFDILLNELQNTIATLALTRQELKNTKENYESRLLAIEEYVNTMSKTYTIVQPDNTTYNFSGKLKKSFEQETLQVSYNINTQKLSIVFNEYLKNTFFGKLVVKNSSQVLYSKFRSEFSLENNTLVIDIINTSFPISVQLYTFTDELILNKPFSL